MTLTKCRFKALLGFAVHRANILTDVASKYPITYQRSQFSGNRATKLNREKRDAPCVVDNVRSDYSARRTGVNAPHTFATGLG